MLTLIHRAILALHPAALPLVDFELRDGGDGQVYVSAWRLPGEPPAAADIAALAATYDAAQVQRDTEAAALRTQVRTLAQSAVGVRIDQLTAAQVRALMAILLWQAGALAPDGTVKELNTWVR